MNFLAPAAFFFALTIPVVIVFYLLKRKRVVRLVSSTVLWQQFLAETQASAPFQKLRKNWLLVLQILLLLLAIFALARPYFAASVKPAELRVVILDGSASMQATDEKPTRFEKARAEALKWVDSLAGTDQMVVLLAAGNTEVKQSATSEKAALRRALQSCRVSDAPTRLVPALRMAESLVREQRNAEIHLFSDGAVSGLEEFENKALPLIYHKVGKTGNNVGIVALDVRANPENRQQRALYVNVFNYSTNARTADLELTFDDKTVERKTIVLPPGQAAPQVFFNQQKEDGVFHVHLESPDDLVVDNDASIVSLLPRPVTIALVTRGNSLLQKALRACPQVRLIVLPDLTGPSTDYDFVVLDGVAPTVFPKGNVLAIRVAQTNWIDEITPLTAPAIVDWRAAHPVMRYAGLENVQVSQSLGAKTPSWAVSLADSPQASLILAGELGRQRIVWVGFDFLESTWPLRFTFPIFIANAVEWLNPANVTGGQLSVKAGDAFRLPLTRPEKTAEVTLPDGEKRSINSEASNASEFVFGETQKQGVYQVRFQTNTVTFCVNLLDTDESNIVPREEIQMGKYAKVTATTTRRANMEVWRTIALFAVLILLGEWWYYHRRTV